MPEMVLATGIATQGSSRGIPARQHCRSSGHGTLEGWLLTVIFILNSLPIRLLFPADWTPKDSVTAQMSTEKHSATEKLLTDLHVAYIQKLGQVHLVYSSKFSLLTTLSVIIQQRHSMKSIITYLKC